MKDLKQFPIVFSIPVQWGDMDSFGHVNNVVYFRWCETARVEYLERVGLSANHGPRGIGPIVARIGCNFRKPIVYPDIVHAGARVTRLGNSSFEMEHAIYTDALGLVADAESTLVVVDYSTGKSVPLPDAIRQAIRELEKREL
jgi:acyl-CoA thioester hydrolase